MSFSSAVKSELCRIENIEDCCLLCELAAAIKICGYFVDIGENSTGIRITTENAAFARRIFSSVKRLFGVYPEISIIKSKKLKKHASYNILLADSEDVRSICSSIGINLYPNDEGKLIPCNQAYEKLYRKACCKKAYLRGAFLAGGSITDPGKVYHMEIVTRSSSIADELVKLMEGYGLNAKIVKRKGSFVTYIKEGENIVDFLNVIGAHKALMELENVRILKEVRNNVNRIVNCETANLGKTVNASLRQIENIKFIRDNIGFDALPAGLREIAEIRLKYSDANLKELGEMLNPPLGKSGVNHRLRKLEMIAEKQKSAGNKRKGI